MPRIQIEPGVANLILAASSVSPLNGERYYLKGDLCQMSRAYTVAQELGLECDIEGGIPFVTSQAALNTLIKHLYDNNIPGYRNYPAPKANQ